MVFLGSGTHDTKPSTLRTLNPKNPKPLIHLDELNHTHPELFRSFCHVFEASVVRFEPSIL